MPSFGLLLGLREETKRGHHSFSRRQERQRVNLFDPQFKTDERRDVLRGIARPIHSVACGANLRIDGGAAGHGCIAAPPSLHHGENPWHLVGVHVKNAVGVGGRSTPLRAAIKPWKNDGSLATRRREGRVRAHSKQLFQCCATRLRRDVGDLVVGQDLPCKGRRSGG